jgi:hypothetical protein
MAKLSAPWIGPFFLRAVGGEGVGRHPHNLEPHEHVEQVAGQAEADHPGQENEHEGVEISRHLFEVAPREHHGGGDEEGAEGGEAGVERPDGEVDADGDPLVRPKPGEPVNAVGPVAADADQDGEQDAGDGGGGGYGDSVQEPARLVQQRVER